MNKLNQKGIGHLIVVLIIVVIGMVVGIGWYVYSSQKNARQTLNTDIKEKDKMNTKGLEANVSDGDSVCYEGLCVKAESRFLYRNDYYGGGFGLKDVETQSSVDIVPRDENFEAPGLNATISINVLSVEKSQSFSGAQLVKYFESSEHPYLTSEYKQEVFSSKCSFKVGEIKVSAIKYFEGCFLTHNGKIYQILYHIVSFVSELSVNTASNVEQAKVLAATPEAQAAASIQKSLFVEQ